MPQKILVVNSGSSTLKFKLFALPKEEVIVKGLVDRLGLDHSVFEITYQGKKHSQEIPIQNHVEAVKILIQQLQDLGVIADVQ